jgi:hypothetical protein
MNVLSYFVAPPPMARADTPTDSSFWAFDKREHFTACALISGSAYVVLRKYEFNRWEALVTSVALGVLIGTAKEVRDERVDPDDIKADTAGAAFAGALFFTVDVLAF